MYDPAADQYPVVQELHVSDPVNLFCVPAGQGVHVLVVWSAYVPTGHVRHRAAPALETLPTPQFMQESSVGTFVYVPAGH